MENFIVSARKYRPTQFDSVVGQSHITTTLKNAIKSNHLAQAFLFCGPRGVGKTTCARILAKTINCESIGADGEACGTCPSCQSFQDNTSLTIHELDAASNNSVDDIRNLIDQVRYPPQRGRYKIYIIDEVHMLSAAAFNAFLKTLEEPPSYAIFILATTEKHKILPTILSRCQIFDFNRIQWKDMAKHLAGIAEKENIQAEPSALELIAIKADGGLRDALSMFDLNVTFSTDNALRHQDVLENLHILDSDYYVALTNHLIQQNHVATLVLLDEIMRKGFDGQQFISGFMEHLRNLLFAKDPQTLALMEISEESRTKFKEQAERTSTSFLLSAMNICSTCESNYKLAKNARLHLELCLLKINYLPSVYQLALEGGTGKKSEPQAKSEGANNQTLATAPAKEPTKSDVSTEATNPVEVLPVVESHDIPIAEEIEQPLPTTKPVAQMPALGLSGLRSSKSVIKNKGKEDEEKEEQSAPGGLINQDFDLTKFLEVWNEIAQKYKDGNLINKFVMMDRPIELIETVAHVKVENEVQVQHFNEQLRMEVLGILRERLSNYTVDIVLDLTEQENDEKKLLYTQSDKFDFLVQKHPLLGELKQKLGLDHEF
ncbi:DNA polymerase III subunit gamma/tau [Aquirufa sp.]|jgi:DNA polymerase-3 subunit gamma/tau|uniref:DNA polymerase III subunit gamma/tau n=1 Tax=Aquirufa sp. TaxID=2676249 RepID=UPI0037C0688F